MQRNNTSLLRRLIQELGHNAENKRVADAVETVLLETLFARGPLVDWVRAYVHGHRLVEGRVEEGDALHGGHFLFADADYFEGGKIVSIFVSLSSLSLLGQEGVKLWIIHTAELDPPTLQDGGRFRL